MKYFISCIFFCILITSTSTAQSNYHTIDSLKLRLGNTTREQKLNVIGDLVYQYYGLSIDTARIYSQMGIDLSRDMNSRKDEAGFIKLLARCYYLTTDFDQSIKKLFEARKIYEEIQDTLGLINIHYAVADIYSGNNQYDLCYEQTKKGLALAKKINNKERIAAFSSMLGLIYKGRDKDYKRSIKYFKQSLRYYKGTDNQPEEAIDLMNISNAYSWLQKNEMALKYLNQALSISKKYNLERIIVFCLMQRGQILKDLGKNELAIKSALEALKIGNYKYQNFRVEGYLLLSEIYSAQKKYKPAYNYLSSYNELYDTLRTKNSKDKIAAVESKYKSQQKQAQITLLEKDNKINALTRNLFIGGFIFALIIAGGLFNRYRYKERTNKQLTTYSNELSEMNDKLESELEQAASYILSLLPQKLTERIQTDWMFIPSAHLGGDSFGYNWLDENNFAFYLIDVSGHGIGASLLTTTILNIIRTKTLPGADFTNPASVLNTLNETFDSEQHEGKYFSLWYGVINVPGKRLVCSSGFHPPALLKSNGTISKLGTKEMMLGIFKEYEYENSSYTLNNGDRIYLFSDGCFELELEEGKNLNFSDFEELILNNSTNTGQPLNNIYKALLSLNGTKPFGDDYSMIEIVV